jgi:phenylacetate-CoA ligase
MSIEDRIPPTAGNRALPHGARLALGFAYRCLPKSWRFGSRYRDFKSLAEQNAVWSWDELREYQLKQLRVVLHHAANHCLFYRRTFARAGFRPEEVREIEDLQHCPTVAKQDVIDHVDEMVSSDIKRAKRLYITTPGETEQAPGFYLQKCVNRPKEQAFFEAMFGRAGYFKGARVALVDQHATHANYDMNRNQLALPLRHGGSEFFQDFLESLMRFKPDFLQASSASAMQLAQSFEERKHTGHISMRALFVGPQALGIPEKRRLEHVFQCRVYRWYGHTQQMLLAGEGSQSELYYFWPIYGLVEFGPPNEDNWCEIIGTSFHNLAMPLIRYRTGDYARLADPRIDGELEFPWPAASAIQSCREESSISGSERRISESRT